MRLPVCLRVSKAQKEEKKKKQVIKKRYLGLWQQSSLKHEAPFLERHFFLLLSALRNGHTLCKESGWQQRGEGGGEGKGERRRRWGGHGHTAKSNFMRALGVAGLFWGGRGA